MKIKFWEAIGMINILFVIGLFTVGCSQPLLEHSEYIVKVNDRNFEQEVLQEGKPVLVYFYTDQHHPAFRNMASALEAIAAKHSDKIKFCYYRMKNDNHLWKKYVSYSGTNVVFENGKKITDSHVWGSEKINQALILFLLKQYLWQHIDTYDPGVKLKDLNADNFSDVISQSDKPKLVVFASRRCLMSQTAKAVFKRIAPKYGKIVDFYSVDYEENPEIKAKYKIKFAPTLIMFVKGKEIERYTGAWTNDSYLNEVTIFSLIYPLLGI